MTSSGRPARLGVFGGTFDPIHVGHLRAAEEGAEALGLAQVLFVPSATPPHKAGHVTAAARERLRWVERAIAGNPRFAVETMELEREGPSYSVETLRVLGARIAPERPVFLIGDDAFREIGSWREPDTLFTLAHFAVLTRPAGRPGSPGDGSLGDWIPDGVRAKIEVAPDGRSARHRGAETWIRLVPITALDVSASDIRERIRAGRSVRYLIPEGVEELVLASGIYAGREESR